MRSFMVYIGSHGCVICVYLWYDDGDDGIHWFVLSVGLQVRWCVGDMFASFLPGILIALTKVVTGDSKQGYKIITVREGGREREYCDEGT